MGETRHQPSTNSLQEARYSCSRRRMSNYEEFSVVADQSRAENPRCVWAVIGHRERRSRTEAYRYIPEVVARRRNAQASRCRGGRWRCGGLVGVGAHWLPMRTKLAA